MPEQTAVYSAKFPSTTAQCRWFAKISDFGTTSDIAKTCSCSLRTIRDWKRGRFRPRYDCVERLCHLYGLKLPPVQKISRLEHLYSASRKGGRALIRKYGGVPVLEKYRRDRWDLWWEETGRKAFLVNHTPLKIKKPRKSSRLAEFVGIMMGDGTLSTYHIGITLNATDDADYIKFVSGLTLDLFGIRPKLLKRKGKNAIALTVSRKLLAEYLHSLGLPMGNKIKQNLDIPAWILENQLYARACVRGLMDTDGSVFTHTYKAKGRMYRYKKISFSSASPALLLSVHRLLTQNGITSHTSKTSVRIDERSSVLNYFNIISSHNKKHLKRVLW